MHHKEIRATFKGKAFALVIPETDTVEKEIVFIPVGMKFLARLSRVIISYL